ncbi:MAG: hypothetical protein E6427_03320 [Anaerococcus sp.]|nr:hypothetical protein [Anaerococcus sp.]
MQLTKLNLTFHNRLHSVTAPLTCPYCGKVVELTERDSTNMFFSKNQEIYLKILFAKCCSKNLAVTYLLEKPQNEKIKIEFISSYPMSSDTYFYPSIQDLSPNCIRLYKDSSFAYDHNMYDLAAMGYRKSLEYLIKDYAIKELNKPKEEVVKKSLYDSISSYMPLQQLINTADVVRLLAKDKTHYQEKYKEYDIEVLKKYLDIFLKLIDTDYSINHPPVYRQN